MADPKITFAVREIQEGDIHKGFFQTLSDLAEVGKISSDMGRARKMLREMMSSPFYRIFVAVNNDGEVLGLTTLLIEQKFIHDGGKVGHIEDVVTRKGYEGAGVGSELIRTALKFAVESKCYKVILDSHEHIAPFYEKLGFRKHSVCMRYDIK